MSALHEVKPDTGAVVTCLADAAEDAVDGLVRSVMVATIGHDGCITVTWAGPSTFYEKLGVLEATKHEMLAACERGEPE